MPCPNCREEGNLDRKQDDGQGFYEKEFYSCPKCGCRWEWEMTKTITKQGKNLEEEEEEDDE